MREPTWPRLRRATNADCEPVRSLVFTVLGEYDLTPDPACTDADLRDIEQSYFQRGGVFYVLEEEDGVIIGSYGLYPIADCGLQIADSTRGATTQSSDPVSSRPQPAPDSQDVAERPQTRAHRPQAPAASSLPPPASPGICELRKMYLHRDYRGKGHGKRLLEHALAEARRLGFQSVTLETASVLTEAIRLYEHYGFHPYSPPHLSPRCDQAYRLELR